jgi:hypothetical protein
MVSRWIVASPMRRRQPNAGNHFEGLALFATETHAKDMEGLLRRVRTIMITQPSCPPSLSGG